MSKIWQIRLRNSMKQGMDVGMDRFDSATKISGGVGAVGDGRNLVTGRSV
jgi:hypothetical protein